MSPFIKIISAALSVVVVVSVVVVEIVVVVTASVVVMVEIVVVWVVDVELLGLLLLSHRSTGGTCHVEVGGGGHVSRSGIFSLNHVDAWETFE